MLGERIADLGLPEDPMRADHVCGQGGGAAVRPLRGLRRDPRARRCARPARSWASRATSRPRSPRRRRRPAPRCPPSGTAFITVTDSDKPGAVGDRPDPPRPRLPDRRHARHRARRSSAWASRRTELNKIGEGSPQRRRLDRERRRRPRRQHADGLGRAHRRLGDPPRRGRARDPVPDDALRRAGRGARDRGRAPGRARRCSRCRSSTPAACRPRPAE